MAKRKSSYTKIVIICAVIFLILSIGVGFIIHEIRSKKTSATNTDNTQIETVQEDTTATDMKLAIQNLLTKIETMEANFETLETLNEELLERNLSVNSDKNSLQTKLNYANANISELKESLQNIKDAYTEIISYYRTVDSESRTNLATIENEYNSLWARYIELSQDNISVDVKTNNQNTLKFDATVNSLVNSEIGKTTISTCELKLTNNLKVYVDNELLKNYQITDRELTASNGVYKITFYCCLDKIDTFTFVGFEIGETYSIEFKQIEANEKNIIRWEFEEIEKYCFIENNTVNLTVIAQDRLLEEDSIISDVLITETVDPESYMELTKENYANVYLNGSLFAKVGIEYGRAFDRESEEYLYPHDYTIRLTNYNLVISKSGAITGTLYVDGVSQTLNIEWVFETYRIN